MNVMQGHVLWVWSKTRSRDVGVVKEGHEKRDRRHFHSCVCDVSLQLVSYSHQSPAVKGWRKDNGQFKLLTRMSNFDL